MESQVKEIRDEIIEELKSAERLLEGASNIMERLEKEVAGLNANYFRAAERLISTASSATEECRSWLEGIK